MTRSRRSDIRAAEGGRTSPLAALVLPALALAGCAAGSRDIAVAPVIVPPSTRQVSAKTEPTKDSRAVEEPRAANAALKESEELLARLKNYRAGPPIWGEPDVGGYRDAKVAIGIAWEYLEKLKEAYEEAPEDGERIARLLLAAGWFLQTKVIAGADPEDRGAAKDIRDNMKRFHDRALGR